MHEDLVDSPEGPMEPLEAVHAVFHGQSGFLCLLERRDSGEGWDAAGRAVGGRQVGSSHLCSFPKSMRTVSASMRRYCALVDKNIVF
jgi:hypothetical protein